MDILRSAGDLVYAALATLALLIVAFFVIRLAAKGLNGVGLSGAANLVNKVGSMASGPEND